MIINSTESHIVSTLGWVDKGSLWCMEVAGEKVQNIVLSQAGFLSIYSGSGETLAVVHHFQSNILEISAHPIESPGQVLSVIRIVDGKSTFSGDLNVWQELPGAYVSFYKLLKQPGYFLFLIDADNQQVELQQFSWFDHRYDHIYQGIVGVTEVPGQDLLIVSIQRDSHPVIYDPKEQKAVGQLSLADQYGNPRLLFRRRKSELWADDYDTLVRIQPEGWVRMNSLRLQPAFSNTSQFTGHFCFNQDESLCAVARPYSGDVVAVDTNRFKITHRAKLSQQPLDVILLNDGRVFARDWKSGCLLKGQLKKTSFFPGTEGSRRLYIHHIHIGMPGQPGKRN